MLEGIQPAFTDNVLYAPFSSLDFPAGRHTHKTKTGKHDKLIALQQIYLLLASCNHVNDILMRKHMHPATPCILHNHTLESLCFSPPLHIAFLSICTLMRTLTAGLSQTSEAFHSGGPSPPAAVPGTDSTAPSLSWSSHLHSICQVFMCLYLCCQNPSKHGSLPFLTHS